MELESCWERYLTHTQIQRNGALTNLGDGIPITTHGIGTRVGGLAAPPQLDLLINSGYYKDGRFTRPEFSRLAVD